MTVKEVVNPKTEKPKIRCSTCGNKARFSANSKTKRIVCDDCGKDVLQAVEDPETYKRLGGK